MPRTLATATSVLAVMLAVLPSALAGLAALPAESAAADDGAVTWSVEPTPTTEGGRRAFNYQTDPGTQIQDSFLITNAGNTQADFIIYATDAFNDPDTGSFSLLKHDDKPTDLGAWITPANDKLTIGPGLQATVPFNLVIPSDATPGDHSAGIVASVLTQSTQPDGSTVVLEQRVGVRMYLTLSGAPVASIETQGLTSSFTSSLNPFAPGDLSVSYQVRNTGNKRVDVNQTIRVEGPFGIPLGSSVPEPLNNLLPRQTVRVKVHLSGIGALLYALSTIGATPGPIGTAGVVTSGPGSTSAPTAGETATPTPASPTIAASPTAGAPDQKTIDYKKVTAQSSTIAITWTLLLLIVIIVALIYLVWRYVSGTRERFYAAIDDAAATAREEALAGRDETEAR